MGFEGTLAAVSHAMSKSVNVLMVRVCQVEREYVVGVWSERRQGLVVCSEEARDSFGRYRHWSDLSG